MQENNAPITRLLMWLNALVMLAVVLFNLYTHNQWALADETLLKWGAIVPRQSSLWTIVSGMFLHAGLIHIAMNMLSLSLLGKEVEPRLGKWFLPFYLATGLVSGLAVYILSNSPTVGASGAICGLFGASIVQVFKFESTRSQKVLTLVDVGILAAISLIPQVSGIGHFFGLVSGMLFATIIFSMNTQDNWVDVDITEINNNEPEIVIAEGYRSKQSKSLAMY